MTENQNNLRSIKIKKFFLQQTNQHFIAEVVQNKKRLLENISGEIISLSQHFPVLKMSETIVDKDQNHKLTDEYSVSI